MYNMYLADKENDIRMGGFLTDECMETVERLVKQAKEEEQAKKAEGGKQNIGGNKSATAVKIKIKAVPKKK